MLAALDLRTKQFTLLDSLARQDKRAILGKAEVARLQEYLDHLAVREHDKPIEWQEPLFPGEKSPQQYALHDKSKKLSGIDCGLFCLFYAVALSYGGGTYIQSGGHAGAPTACSSAGCRQDLVHLIKSCQICHLF